MKHYELLTLVSGKYAEHELEPVTTMIEDTLRKHGALIQYTNSWGRRKLSYPIDHNFYGYYILTEFDGDPSIVNQVNKDITLSNEIMRHHIAFKVPGIEPMMPFGGARETITLARDKEKSERTPFSSNSTETPKQIKKAVDKVVSDASGELGQNVPELDGTPVATVAPVAPTEPMSSEELDKKLDEILNNTII